MQASHLLQVGTCTRRDNVVLCACKYPLAVDSSGVTSMDFVRFEYRPQALPQLQAAVLAALEAGAERVVLDLDSLSALDDEATRGLITLLRRSRDIGGEIALSVNRPELRTELLSMALDRLFPLVQTEAAA